MNHYFYSSEQQEKFETGPLSGTKVANTGKIGQLEDILVLWISGHIHDAEPHLLKAERIARKYLDHGAEFLYRSFRFPHFTSADEFRKIAREGLTIHHHRPAHRPDIVKTLESWTTDPAFSAMYNAHWTAPWVTIKKKANDLDALISFVDFEIKNRPHYFLACQSEVIVKALKSAHYSPEEIFVDRRVLDMLGISVKGKGDTFPLTRIA